MTPTARRVLTFLVVSPLLLVTAVAAIWAYRSRPSQRVFFAPGSEVRFDDFVFALASPPARLAEQPEFVRLGVQISNRAKHVKYKIRPEVIRLVDDRGVELAAVPACTRGCESEIPAGEVCEIELCYRLASDRLPHDVAFRFGGAIVSGLDVAIYSDRRLRLAREAAAVGDR